MRQACGPFYEGISVSLIDRFEAVVREHSSLTAVEVEDGSTFTFSALNELAANLAQHVVASLDRHGLTTNADERENDTPLVCVMMSRHVGLVASILAVFKSGGGYVPVDPTFPPDRQSYVIKKAQCKVAIMDKESLEKAKETGVELPPEVILIDNKTVKVLNAKELPPAQQLQASMTEKRADCHKRRQGGLAYVLFTSGSTGLPKGVSVRQQPVVHQVDWFAEKLAFGPGKRFCALSTFCFDISVLELQCPLITGGTIVLCFSSTQRDPFRLMDILEQKGVNVLQMTPTGYDLLLALGWRGNPNIDMLVGGEAFRPQLLKLLEKGKSLLNIYGPTETVMWATYFDVPRSFLARHQQGEVVKIPVGKPIPRYIFFLANEHDPTKLVTEPRGEGELLIAGIGTENFYINAPELTAKAYIDCPFPGEYRGKVYRTGDLVTQDAEGNYVFIRRMDDQVKVDGFRIELAEIESVFLLDERVSQAVVVLRDARLVLYVKPAAPPLTEADLEDIRARAARKLMPYMIPKATVVVEGFSLTVTGKIDRKVLPPAPDVPKPQALPADEPPGTPNTRMSFSDCPESPDSTAGSTFSAVTRRNTVEAMLLKAIFQLRGRRIGPNASFSSIGVDSLGSVLFMKYISDTFDGVRISPASLYSQGVTVRSFARNLHKQLAADKPHVLEAMGLPLDPDALDLSVLRDGDEEEEEEEEEDAKEEWEKEQEAAFDAVLLRNKMFLEGMRGILSFLVLWDHFHRVDVPISNSFVADTSLFVMYSGFTTVFQLRETPKFRYKNWKARRKAKAGGGSASPGDVESTERELLPRTPFNWKMFLVSRATGVFPIYWFCLALYAPYWLFARRHRAELDAQGVGGWGKGVTQQQWWAEENACSALYVLDLECWYRTDNGGCKYHGPNMLLYASIIWSIFVMYVIIRVPLERAQMLALRLTGSGVGAAWKTQVRELAYRLSYNRPRDFKELGLFMLGWFVFNTGILSTLLTSGMKNGLAFLPHFVLGASAANVLECWHYVRFKTRHEKGLPNAPAAGDEEKCDSLSKKQQQQQQQQEGGDVSPAALVAPLDEEQGSSGSLQDDTRAPQPVFSTKVFPSSAAQQDHAEQAHKGEEQLRQQQASLFGKDTLERVLLQAWRPGHSSDHVWRFLWRFFPDAFAVCTGIIMSTLTPALNARDPPPGGGPVQWFMQAALPLWFMAYGLVSMMQEGSDAINGSRLFLETLLMRSIGYCSYPLYMLQLLINQTWRSSLEYYSQTGQWEYFRTEDKNFATPQEGQANQSQHSISYTTETLILVIIFSYILQYLVQDCLVGFLYSRVVGCIFSKSKRTMDQVSAM